jgi:virulence-associated protein VagC
MNGASAEYECSECGSPVQEADRVCGKCGADLEETILDEENRNIKLTAALYASRPGVLEHLKLKGRLPKQIDFSGAEIAARLLIEKRGRDITLTPDEKLVYDALAAPIVYRNHIISDWLDYIEKKFSDRTLFDIARRSRGWEAVNIDVIAKTNGTVIWFGLSEDLKTLWSYQFSNHKSKSSFVNDPVFGLSEWAVDQIDDDLSCPVERGWIDEQYYFCGIILRSALIDPAYPSVQHFTNYYGPLSLLLPQFVVDSLVEMGIVAKRSVVIEPVMPKQKDSVVVSVKHNSKRRHKSNDSMKEGLIVLRNFPDEVQAELAKGLLVSQGIEAITRRIDTTVMGPLNEVILGVDVLIHAEDRKKATKVLEAMRII